ncbi:MAG: RnfABCDGE type electron transport complex subunit D [Hydrogenophilaceae bacterium]|nr:RnfABCDGE type electron transport complex subunit D [Hydrogenophilaceae bacterium]
MTGSPYITQTRRPTSRIMLLVMLALLPGIAAHWWLFGPGILVSLLLCSLFAIGFESLALLMRNLPIRPHLQDNTALVTAWLLALSMPTLAPWWLYLVGVFFAIIVAKHFYGGMGQNLFNPAMVGFAVLILSFPVQMTQWPAPVALAAHVPSLAEAFDLVFAGQGTLSVDAYTSATPLDSLKTQLRAGTAFDEITSQSIFGHFGGSGGEVVAFMFLLGGLLLLAQRLITWHIPVAFLAAIALTASAVQILEPGQQADALFHLATGGAMLGAFFIATDPVTAASTPHGKLIYAAGAGFLTVIIRIYGNFPDGVAFAVLLMNIAAPLIDLYTQPRIFGQTGKSGRNRP